MFKINKLSQFISSINLSYLLALIVFWGWAISTKILMAIGFLNEISKGNKLYFLSMSIVIILFIAEYLFLGQSRWRAPLDPIFMMLAAVGFTMLVNRFMDLLLSYKK